MKSGSRRRRQRSVTPELALRWADRLGRRQVPVRIAVAWNGSFHAADYDLMLRFGPAIRRPQSINEIRRRIESADLEAIRRWSYSRRR